MAGTAQIAFAAAVFLTTYAIVISEKIHRTIIVLAGSALIVVFGVLDFYQAIEAIDFNVIGLLAAMMVMVGLTRQSGIIEFAAVSVAKLSRGNPAIIMTVLSLLVAVLSALLDNVTTVLIAVPISISVAHKLEIDPLPIVISEVILSNIGGAATLIGDPPNLLIGSASGLGFMDFVVNLLPILLIVMAMTLFLLWMIYRKRLKVTPESRDRLMAMDAGGELKDPSLAVQTLVILGLTVIGFVFHQNLGLESATVAICGAALMLLVVRPDPEQAFSHVEWPVIFFFVGLFVLVGSLEAVGIIEWLATVSLRLTGGELMPTGIVILWLSAIASAFVDNIPFTATMIPLIQEIGLQSSLVSIEPLWWCLALGACLGGNGTLVGASANVVAVGMLEEDGYKISFLRYMAVGFPLMLLSVAASMLYLAAFYLQ